MQVESIKELIMDAKAQVITDKSFQDAAVLKNPEEDEHCYETDDDEICVATSTSECSSLSGDESVNHNEPVVLMRKLNDDLDILRVRVGDKLWTSTPAVDAAPSAGWQSTAEDGLQAGFQQLFGLPATEETEQQISSSPISNCDDKEETPDSDKTNESKTDPVSHQNTEEKTDSDIDHSQKQDAAVKEAVLPQPQLASSTTEEETQPYAPTTLEAFQFEARYAGFAVSAFLCYCVAHLAIYELMYGLLLELSDARVQSKYLLYSGLMVAGLVVLRFTGLLWQFLSTKRYRATKREMRKRQSWDKKLMEWIEEKPILKTTLDIVGFYLCYLAFAFFWSEFFLIFDQRDHIYSMLPSTQYYEQVVRGPTGSLAVDLNVPNGGDSCAWAKNFDDEDYDFIYHNVAKASYYHYSGSSEAPLYTVAMGTMIYVSAASLSLYYLSKVGYGFVDNW